MNQLATVFDGIAEFRLGRPVVIVDDEDRENEGDLAIPAAFATADVIALMASEARGLICMPTIGERLDQLHLPLISPRTAPDAAAFTIPVDARDGLASGISAADRARTVATILDPSSAPEDLVSPGHLFPLRYAEGGVLARPGHTEASVDLARLAGLYPAAVICEILTDDGRMARLGDLVAFARRHALALLSVASLVEHRARDRENAQGRREQASYSPANSARGLYFLSDLLR